MDPVANLTAGANTPAPDDAMDVDQQRGADWPHWPVRGNGPARRDRLERRLFRDSEREAEMAEAQETVRQIAHAAAVRAADVERLESALSALGYEPEPQPEPDIEPEADPVAAADYLLFAWAPYGYAFHEGRGETPAVGARVAVNGHVYSVAKLAPSPLPGDGRPCAYLEPL